MCFDTTALFCDKPHSGLSRKMEAEIDRTLANLSKLAAITARLSAHSRRRDWGADVMQALSIIGQEGSTSAEALEFLAEVRKTHALNGNDTLRLLPHVESHFRN